MNTDRLKHSITRAETTNNINNLKMAGTAVCSCHPSAQETEAWGCLEISGQAGKAWALGQWEALHQGRQMLFLRMTPKLVPLASINTHICAHTHTSVYTHSHKKDLWPKSIRSSWRGWGTTSKTSNFTKWTTINFTRAKIIAHVTVSSRMWLSQSSVIK